MGISYIPPKNNKAQNIKIDDTSNHFDSSTVEGALKELAERNTGGGTDVDLSNYATKQDLAGKANINHGHNNYSETTHNHNSQYATKSSEHNHTNKNALDKVTDNKINEWNSKANYDHYHDEYAPSTHNHDFSYYKKSETYTKSEANNKISEEIAKAQIGGGNGDIDLSAYATKADLETKANKNHLHPGYALDDHDHNDLYYRKNEVYTKGETETKILEEILNIGVGAPDLSNYATKQDLAGKSDINHNHNDLYANTNHTHDNYSPNTHNHDSKYAVKSSEHTHTNKVALDKVTDGKINEWNSKANSNHVHSNYSETTHNHDNTYAKKSETYTISQTENKINELIENSKQGVPKLWTGTKEEYDRITSKDTNTIYFIKEN